MKNNFFKKCIIMIIFLFLIIIFATIFLKNFNFINTNLKFTNANENKEKLKVVTTFYPLYEFAKQIGGNNIIVESITSIGVEPHDFEPTPKDLVKINSADIFVLNGANFEPWAEKIIPKLNKKGILVLKMSDNFNILKNNKDYQENFNDPHFWLDPILAKKQIELLKDVFIKLDTKNLTKYENNFKTYVQKLEELNLKYKNELSKCKLNDIVVSHNALGYLSKRYNFNVISISGLSPHDEPSPQKMAQITDLIFDKNIKYVFFETLVSPKIAESLALETKIKTLVFNPIEGLTSEGVLKGENYITIMQQNLDNLKTAMLCE